MVNRTVIVILILAAGLILAIPPAFAEEQVQDVVIYQTAFSGDPHWTTNSPRFFYWVPEKGIYHYAIEPGSGANAYVEVDYKQGPFTLEFDITPTNTPEHSSFRLGLTSEEMQRTKGTVALAEFTNWKYGNLMWIRAVTPSNKLFEISSESYSYGAKTGAPTVNYADNRTYHITLQYDDVRNTLTMRVYDKTAGSQIWTYFLTLNEALRDMNRIVIGTIGDYSATGVIAEGYIDNVKLTTQQTVTVTTQPTPAVTTQAPVTTRTTVKKTTQPTPAAPVDTTPESPLSPALGLAAVGIIGAAFACGRRRPKR
ncbi:MAG: hypothetical protein A4E35_00530 [Methanoregula sp. PtaU1.Bin051]|nr:MAG: hypothetical protein A4E35_00530 [Methanoregula sp. PtaU1.Bin051]